MAKRKAKAPAKDKKQAASKKNAAAHDVTEDLIEEMVDDTLIESEPEEKPSKSKKSRGGDSGSVYKVIEVIGSSTKSWEHAAQVAVERASQTLEDLRVAEVVDQDLKIENGTISAYRTKLRLSFKFKDNS